MNASGSYDHEHGCILYNYVTEQPIDIELNNSIDISQNGAPKIQFKLLNGEIVYNHWDVVMEAFEQVNHQLTSTGVQQQSDFLQVVSSQALVLNQDMQAFTQDQVHGSSIELIANSRIRLQQGKYWVTISAAVDFSNANGHLHIVLMNHATHQAILTPALRSTLEISPGTNADDIGSGSNTFIIDIGAQTDLCLRPTVITNLQGNIYVNVSILRIL